MTHLKILAIGSTTKGCGKTALGTFLVPHLGVGAAAAVRVTPKHKLSLAGPEIDMAITAENAEPRPYILESGLDVVWIKGTDTRRYWDAGADPVYWLRARDESMVEGVNSIVKELDQRHEGPTWLVVEGTRYLSAGGRADVALMVYPNGSSDFSGPDCDLTAIRRCDALVVAKRRPGSVVLRLLDAPTYPPDRLDLPVFAFNVDPDSLAMDDRFALAEWLKDRVTLVGAQTSSKGEDFLN